MLQGTLETMLVEEVFQWCSQKSRTGVLQFKRANVTKRIALENGLVIHATSTDPREFLGQFLLNQGLLNEEQLQKAFETQQETKVRLGKILVMAGVVSERQIHRTLDLKVRESSLDLFLWDQGSFQYQEGTLRKETAIPVAVDLTALYIEGLERRRSFQVIRQVIPDNSYCFLLQKERLPGNLDPRSPEKSLLQLVEQRLSVADMILRLHSLDYPVLKNLAEMVDRGWLALLDPAEISCPEILLDAASADPRATGISDAESYLLAAQGALQQRQFDKAINLIKQGMSAFPYDSTLCDALDLAERGLVETLHSELLSQERIPYMIQEDLQQTSNPWTPAERYILSRVDGQRTLKSIVMVSPLKEVEALKTFRSLIKGGFIALK